MEKSLSTIYICLTTGASLSPTAYLTLSLLAATFVVFSITFAHRMSVLIWNRTVDTLIVFVKEFFEKVIFWFNLTLTSLLKQLEASISKMINIKIFLPIIDLVFFRIMLKGYIFQWLFSYHQILF